MLTSSKSNDQSTTLKKMGEQQQQQQQTKKKGSKINPNRTDKAGRTKIFYATTAGHLDKVQELVEMGANVNLVDNAGWTPLHEAALKGQFIIAKYLIECGANVNVQGFGQDTPLHDAAANGFADIVKLLVDAGANIFALNEHNERPIDLCEETEDAHKILQKKMDALDKLIARDENGQTSLHRACLDKNLDKVAKLIQQGANVNAQDNKHQATPLHLICQHHHYEPTLLDMVKLLVKKSAVVDIQDSDGNTPLHEASRLGHTELVQFLVTQANADVHIENTKQHTAYDAASHPPVRQILTARMDEVRLEKVASNALDEIAGKTAKKKEPERQLTREERKIQNYMKAFASMNNNNEETTARPKRDNATPPPQATTKRRKTISETFSSEEQEEAEEKKRAKSPSPVALRKKKATKPGRTRTKSATPESIKPNTTKLDPFKKDTSGRTQLFKYVLKGNETNVTKLLHLGADPNTADHAGWTPLHEAALEGHIDMVRLLLNHNANINAQGGNNMDTPLHDAVENNHCNVVELLLDHGADPFARNAQNAEPIDIAIEKKYDDIVLVLEARNPVSRKKKDGDTQQQKKNKKKSLVNKRKEKPDIETTSSSYTDVQPKKRRLVQAADLEKTKSPNEEEQEAKLEKDTRMDETKHGNAIVEKRKYKTKRKIKVDEEEEEEEEEVEQKVEKKKKEKVVKKKEEEKEVTVKIEPEEQRRYWNPRKQLHDTTTTTSTAAAAAAAMAAASGVAPADPHSPIPTPPPEFGMLMTSKQKEDALQYLPLYTVQLKSIFYVVDYQVSLLLGMNDSHQLWSTYPDLPKRLITLEEKTRLWSHLKTMLKQQDRQTFLDKPLYFIQLDDIVTLIKSNFNYLCSRLITITLDMGYQEKKNQDEKSLSLSKYRHSLPPKMRMKLGGYVNPSSPPPPSS